MERGGSGRLEKDIKDHYCHLISVYVYSMYVCMVITAFPFRATQIKEFIVSYKIETVRGSVNA